MRQHVFQLIVQLDVEEGKPKRKKAVQVELDLQPDHLDHGVWDEALQVLNVEMRLATIEVSVYPGHVRTVPLEFHLNTKGWNVKDSEACQIDLPFCPSTWRLHKVVWSFSKVDQDVHEAIQVLCTWQNSAWDAKKFNSINSYFLPYHGKTPEKQR